jgi:NTE family protein
MKMIKNLFGFSSRKESLGICLSGGGALGFAHIGVLQSLEDHGIFPSHIVGSSMGAIVGTLYAAGYSPAEMLKLVKNDKLYKITTLMTFRLNFLKSGVSTHAMLRSLIHELVPHNSFEQLKKRMYICVVNLNTAEWEIIDSGDTLDKWVAASASIPGVFETVMDGETNYVDGGLLNNMPAQGLSGICDTIIGVDVIPQKNPMQLKKPIDTLAFSIRAMQHQNSKEGRSMCKFIIEPQAIEEFHEFSFDAYQAIYQHGYSAATKFIVDNPEIMMLRE